MYVVEAKVRRVVDGDTLAFAFVGAPPFALRVNAVLGTRSSFCTPYTSQERGTVENTAGLVRRVFPKRTNFDILQRTEVKAVERWLTHRPRRVLKFQTPAEVFRSGVVLRG